MTPETDPRQNVDTAVTPGKGLHPEIDLARRIEETQRRHPARFSPDAYGRYGALPLYEVGEAATPQERAEAEAWSDDALDVSVGFGGATFGGAPIVRARHRKGPPLRKRDAARAALRRMLPGGQA